MERETKPTAVTAAQVQTWFREGPGAMAAQAIQDALGISRMDGETVIRAVVRALPDLLRERDALRAELLKEFDRLENALRERDEARRQRDALVGLLRLARPMLAMLKLPGESLSGSWGPPDDLLGQIDTALAKAGSDS